ncbi:hypothetical protein ACX0G9_08880 [Flavitalea flava]
MEKSNELTTGQLPEGASSDPNVERFIRFGIRSLKDRHSPVPRTGIRLYLGQAFACTSSNQSGI